ANLNLNIKTGVEVSAEAIRKENPEFTILATGSSPIIPNIPGVEKDKVSTAIDVLLGKKKVREKVLVVGGGLIGCETALWLAQQGKKVTIVEILNDLMIAGIPVQHMNRLMLLDLLKFHRVEVFTNTSLLEVTKNGVLLLDEDSQKKNFPADTIVLAIGLEPDRGLYQTLKGQTPNLYAIGDSRKTQNILNSIWDAYEVARMI
ncbi:MAG: NADH:flavin oxidoreductase, partial [Deltaproteobacteria bacterium]|nr:NADH:flavin oxidoreductase [Deltaproteobacteria bacterium]